MMRVAIAASLAAVGQGFNVTSNVACTETHVTYKQANLTVPNGGYTADALACQTTCLHMVYCDSFTWHPQAKEHEHDHELGEVHDAADHAAELMMTTPGACFLFGNQAVKVANPDTISGPAKCGNTTTVVATDAEPLAAAAVADSSSSKGGSFPWMIILALLLALCLVGGCVAYGCMTMKEKKEKKSKRGARLSDPEASETAPVLQEVQMEPVPMYYTSSQVSVPPQTYYYTEQGPVLATEGMQLQPVDYQYMQQPEVQYQYVQGDVQYVMEQPQV